MSSTYEKHSRTWLEGKIETLEAEIERNKSAVAAVHSLPAGRAFSEFGGNTGGRVYALKAERAALKAEVERLEASEFNLATLRTHSENQQQELERLNKSRASLREALATAQRDALLKAASADMPVSIFGNSTDSPLRRWLRERAGGE